MMRGLIVAALLAQVVVARPAVRPWEHGWRTDRVVATRYTNPVMGYSVGFKFPLNPNDCDRTELADFLEARGGNVYSAGGYPGAEMHAVFDDVTNKEEANRKLKAILPAFDALVASFSRARRSGR